MEIINYVQEPKKRSSVRFFRNTSGIFSPKNKNRSAGSSAFLLSKKPFSFRRLFGGIWRGVSCVGSFVTKKRKVILIVLSILVVAAALTSASIYFYLNIVNHTGPIAFNNTDREDYISLDRMMNRFAMDEKDIEDELTDEAISLENLIITQPVSFQTYKVKSGDTISGITSRFGLRNISTLISTNNISNVRQLTAGQKLKIPSMDGIVYTVKKGDSIDSVVAKYKIKMETLLDVNELSSETLSVGQSLFIPGAALDNVTLKNALGELFIVPISAPFRWTSPYGWREDPIAKVRSFHTGVDLACPKGTPILASQSGKVVTVAQSRVYGNYIILDHGNGYRTLYAHMSKTLAKKGTWVNQGAKIGLVGSTGYSTGNHLHFMVFKNDIRINPMTVLK